MPTIQQRRGRRLAIARGAADASWSQAEPSRRHVLVLGAGFLGANICQALTANGHTVTVATRSAPPPDMARLMRDARLRLRDLSTAAAIEDLLPGVDDVVYALGSSSPSQSQHDAAADVSTVLPPLLHLLDLLRRTPRVRLIYLSSGGAIYGNAPSALVDESTVPRPISSYGILKLMAEHYIGLYAEQHGMKATVLRIANVYGAGQPWANGQGIVARLARCVDTGEPFPVFGDGRAVRDYIHVDDVADVAARIVARPGPHRILNVGSGQGHTTLEVIAMVEQAAGATIELSFADSRGFDVRSVVLDITRLRETMPFSPIPLRDGLRGMWQQRAVGDLSAEAAAAAHAASAR